MKIVQNKGYVKWGKRQLQEVRHAVFSPSLKAQPILHVEGNIKISGIDWRGKALRQFEVYILL